MLTMRAVILRHEEIEVEVEGIVDIGYWNPLEWMGLEYELVKDAAHPVDNVLSVLGCQVVVVRHDCINQVPPPCLVDEPERREVFNGRMQLCALDVRTDMVSTQRFHTACPVVLSIQEGVGLVVSPRHKL
jgi:hypothetical protein